MISSYLKTQATAYLFVLFVFFAVFVAQAADEPENLALDKPVTMSGGAGQGAAEMLTDGKTESDPYLGGPTWVQVDLEDDLVIDTIKIWHYWDDGRTYHDNKVAVSDKGDFKGEEIVVFDSNDADEEYPETAEGKTITFDPVEVRYIRAWVGGSTANQWSHWVELQAFHLGNNQSVSPAGALPITWGRVKSQ